MNRSDIVELHFITLIANVPSIMKHGILSHKLAAKVSHRSVGMPEIQERRKCKDIPGARNLHDYANLYFDAHNPMLSKRREQNNEICVLRVDAKILDLPGVIISDRNAASDWAHFSPVVEGLKALVRDRVFAQYWTHPEDPRDEMSHKSEKCAEILVPDSVRPHYIIGAYVANQTALLMFQQQNIELQVCVKSGIFF